jgi:hypothetical protein
MISAREPVSWFANAADALFPDSSFSSLMHRILSTIADMVGFSAISCNNKMLSSPWLRLAIVNLPMIERTNRI